MSYSYDFAMFKLDRDFHKEVPNIKEGTILELVSIEYQKDYQQYFACFKIIGNPVDKSPSVNIVYK